MNIPLFLSPWFLMFLSSFSKIGVISVNLCQKTLVNPVKMFFFKQSQFHQSVIIFKHNPISSFSAQLLLLTLFQNFSNKPNFQNPRSGVFGG